MLDLFAPIKCLLREESVCIDNVIFRLHSRVTVLLLVVCTILVTAKQYIGEPISCMTDGTIDKDSVNAYCWIYSTFTVSRHLNGVPGQSVASAGVGQALPDDEARHHRYYQWVCFVLGLQAILFYVPRALWGVWERGTVGSLSRDLASPFLRDVWTAERKQQLVDYFTRTHLHGHNFYALRFLACELLNFLNSVSATLPPFSSHPPPISFASDKMTREEDPSERISAAAVNTYSQSAEIVTSEAKKLPGNKHALGEIANLGAAFYRARQMGQIYLLDVFLEGQFRRYGPLVSAFALEENPYDRVDPMARLFPKMTKCTIHSFGPAGSVQTHDALCVLPLNVVNEKIFVVLWFWLVFLAAASLLAVVYRIIVFSQSWTRVYLLRGAARVLRRSKAERVVRVFHFGDWFLLQQLAENVNPLVYQELVNEIAKAFATKSFTNLA
ncbi:innexin inx2 [Harpegnathos saltator]|uniref:innexin inx2 n=1 Tax=Harpegnathos saltator TaxID=610380 RepID=UPI000DBEE9B7|nr:innexin inx2 [Harpegnathos saltator]